MPPMTDCPLCKGVGCGFCNGTGRVVEIILDPDDYDDIAMGLTGTDTIEDAMKALARGPQ